jgi:dTDP-4-amino-4,6-dideoxy-D-galactose acyltransferase
MSYERLEWDSDFFGFAVGRVDAGSELSAAVAAADADGARCLYCLCPADRWDSLEAAFALGFRLYDVRLELGRELPAEEAAESAVREARPEEHAALEAIARERLRGTRFWNDRRFDRARVADLYAAWVRRGLETPPERRTLVAGDAEGFVTCRFDEDGGLGTIELIAVAAEAEGRGLGRRLLAGADAAFEAAGLTRAAVVTQAGNAAAQRLYQGAGYRSTRADLWLHRWSD